MKQKAPDAKSVSAPDCPETSTKSQPANSELRLRPCPICGKPAVFEMRPFCSKRCADVDLHRWLGGSYAIPAVEEKNNERADPEEEI